MPLKFKSNHPWLKKILRQHIMMATHSNASYWRFNCACIVSHTRHTGTSVYRCDAVFIIFLFLLYYGISESICETKKKIIPDTTKRQLLYKVPGRLHQYRNWLDESQFLFFIQVDNRFFHAGEYFAPKKEN